jgi:NAD(P)-dependent dehydrogenase (short-subunit alcohol dehydrogenase family)
VADFLAGKVIVVTGAGRGIGRAIAVEAAAAGARVAVVSRSKDELEETVTAISQRGGQGAAFPASVIDATSMANVFDRVVSCYGAIDVLVNNAGTLGPLGPFAENDRDDWWAAMEINLRGPAICTQAVLPTMLERRAGRIVNVASGGAATAMTHFSSYIVAKTALLRLTECVAAEVRPYGLSVFAIGPGTVRTAMSEHSLTSPEGRRWLPWFRRIFDEGRDVPAEVPARLVTALASGRYDVLSGRFLTVADDLERLLQSSSQIDREQLYALRVNRLPMSETASTASREVHNS